MWAPETARRNRPMNHRVPIAKAAGKDGRVLVLGRHDRAEPGEGDEVFRLRQRHQRSAVRVGRVGDDPLAAVLVDPGHTSVFHAPLFFRVVCRIGRETGLGVDPPVRHAVVAPGHGQMRMSPAVLDADEQDRFLAQLTRAGVEHRVGRIGPVSGGQDGVVAVAMEQLRVLVGCFRFSTHVRFSWVKLRTRHAPRDAFPHAVRAEHARRSGRSIPSTSRRASIPLPGSDSRRTP